MAAMLLELYCQVFRSRNTFCANGDPNWCGVLRVSDTNAGEPSDTSYADLTYTVGLNNEEYGVGFRKGSDLTEALNEFFSSSYKSGSMTTCAETYGVQAAVIEQ